MSIPPKPKPRIAPSNAAVSVVLVAEPGVLRENRAAVYASERVQKASRTYMGEYLLERLCHELSGYRKNF
jgi:hypothetical protein